MRAREDLQARGKRIWIRAFFVVVVVAAMLFLPSPSEQKAIALYDSLLLIIFAMGVIGLTGPAVLFVASTSLLVTAALPVALLSWVSMDSQGSFASALAFVVSALTETDPMGVIWLLVPSAVASLAAFWLSHSGFTLRFRKA